MRPSAIRGIFAIRAHRHQRFKLVHFHFVRRVVFLSGEVQHYEGTKGDERKVRAVLPSGQEQHFEDAKGAERKVRVVFPNGKELYHKPPGPWGNQKTRGRIGPKYESWYNPTPKEQRNFADNTKTLHIE